MAEVKRQIQLLRSGNFEVDLRTGEMRKAGVKLAFGGQPFQVLSILLERPGDLVTRNELQKRLWPDTFVDVDHNLNTAINKIREVLGDSAERPRFIETLSRRGYRFIGELEPPAQIDAGSYGETKNERLKEKSRKRFRRWLLLGAAVLAVILTPIRIFAALRPPCTSRDMPKSPTMAAQSWPWELTASGLSQRLSRLGPSSPGGHFRG